MDFLLKKKQFEAHEVLLPNKVLQVDDWVKMKLNDFPYMANKTPGLTFFLASWLSWQDLAKFLLHLGNHGSHGKIFTKIILR